MPKPHGFTLIELMMVLAIAAAIFAFAIPAYTEYSTRSKIQEAASQLSQWRTRMEQYYLDNRRYSTAAATTDCGGSAPAAANARYFAYSCVSASNNAAGAQTYTLTATGQGFTFTLDNAGAKQTTAVPSGWTQPSPNNCWVQKKQGSC